jgi:hypothetical protein
LERETGFGLESGVPQRKSPYGFYPKLHPPDDPVGIIGASVIVPPNRIVEVVVPDNRKSIVQISVHGGPRPWNKFSLGSGNGAATIEEAELLSRRKKRLGVTSVQDRFMN